MNAEPALKVVETTRFCRDCRWCSQGAAPRCFAPQNYRDELSMVTGEMDRTPIVEFCAVQRTTRVQGERCGREGKWFEPREADAQSFQPADISPSTTEER